MVSAKRTMGVWVVTATRTASRSRMSTQWTVTPSSVKSWLSRENASPYTSATATTWLPARTPTTSRAMWIAAMPDETRTRPLRLRGWRRRFQKREWWGCGSGWSRRSRVAGCPTPRRGRGSRGMCSQRRGGWEERRGCHAESGGVPRVDGAGAATRVATWVGEVEFLRGVIVEVPGKNEVVIASF